MIINTYLTFLDHLKITIWIVDYRFYTLSLFCCSSLDPKTRTAFHGTKDRVKIIVE